MNLSYHSARVEAFLEAAAVSCPFCAQGNRPRHELGGYWFHDLSDGERVSCDAPEINGLHLRELTMTIIPDSEPFPKCDPEVYQNGTVVAVLGTGKRQCDWLVAQAAHMTGQKVDWFSAGGRGVIKARGDVVAVREWFRKYLGLAYRIVEENGEWT